MVSCRNLKVRRLRECRLYQVLNLISGHADFIKGRANRVRRLTNIGYRFCYLLNIRA